MRHIIFIPLLLFCCVSGTLITDKIKEYPDKPSFYPDVKMSILKANIVYSHLFGDKSLYVQCKLENKSRNTVLTSDLGLSHNYFAVLTPDGKIFSDRLKVLLSSPWRILKGEEEMWEDTLMIYDKEIGVYKYYWVFHNKVLDDPIEVEKLIDGNFKLLNFQSTENKDSE